MLIKNFIEIQKDQIEKENLELYFNEYRRLMLIPKKLNDTSFCNNYKIRLNLFDIFQMLVDILFHFYQDKLNKKFHEYEVSIMNIMVNYIVVNLIKYEYHHSELFTKLVKDIVDKDCTQEIQKKGFSIFNRLTQFDFLITDQYLIYDKHILELSNL